MGWSSKFFRRKSIKIWKLYLLTQRLQVIDLLHSKQYFDWFLPTSGNDDERPWLRFWSTRRFYQMSKWIFCTCIDWMNPQNSLILFSILNHIAAAVSRRLNVYVDCPLHTVQLEFKILMMPPLMNSRDNKHLTKPLLYKLKDNMAGIYSSTGNFYTII